ncbi:MAG: SDR family oxidoreductase [Alphaproteobacteria bacterium]|nr:SDR family oxidoreductase [Alphaproteobacteria bacterium]
MRLFIFGPGYSAQHFVELYRGRFSAIHATARTAEKASALNKAGILPLRLDEAGSAASMSECLAQCRNALICAAPGDKGDPALNDHGPAFETLPAGARIVYLSTIGVYGDHGGAWVDENTPCTPANARSRARLAAEEQWRDFSARKNCNLHILRLAGIYGPGRSAINTLRAGTARRIVKPGQIFNRIHAHDIAGAIAACLASDLPPALRTGAHVWNVSDDEPSPPQEVVEYAATLLGMVPPPEVAFEDAQLSPMARSFYGESKRVSNRAMKEILGVRLGYASYRDGLKSCL